MQENSENKILSNESISTFKRATEEMVQKNASSWRERYGSFYNHRLKNYSLEEIEEIINSASLASQQKLSRNYFDKDGLYKKIIYYYGTLLAYSGLLIPNPSFGKQLSQSNISKRYYQALNYVNRIHCAEMFTRMSIGALIDGSYYGILQKLEKDEFVLFDLPARFCRSCYKDVYGNDIVEFDVTYFNDIPDIEMRTEALNTYPKEISRYYRQYMKGKKMTSWVKLPAHIGICFQFYEDGRPLFLSTIPATIHYDEAIVTERERDLEEIRKIIVQKMPHLNDGTLLFEPEEAAVMHSGAVGMMKTSPNVSVLTTYADVDAIQSRTAADNVSNTLERMLNNVYAEAGVSSQIFAPTGGQALKTSIQNDVALMMILGNKYARFMTYVVNKIFANSNLTFDYVMLPISNYNRSDYLADSLKLVQYGYSYIIPALALGLRQQDLSNLKMLENDILKLQQSLIPPQSANTQPASSTSADENTGGRPETELEEKAPKTIQNEEAIDNNGGSLNEQITN